MEGDLENNKYQKSRLIWAKIIVETEDCKSSLKYYDNKQYLKQRHISDTMEEINHK